MCLSKRISRDAGFVLAMAVAAVGCASKPPRPAASQTIVPLGETIPLVGLYKVHRYAFPNGLRLLVVEDHSSPTFAYQTWFRVGSRDEVPGRTGLAHLFEHLMFKGTTNFKEGDFDRILEGAGVEGENAFTNRDYTAYIEELPRKDLDLAAKLESDRMVNLVVNDESFKTEREVVQNERRFRDENNPDGTMYQEIFSIAFTQHPYHWPVIGYSRDLESMTAEDARTFYKSYYSPNHATVVVVGDVDPGEVYLTVGKYYSPLPAVASPVHVIEPEPPQESTRRKTLRLNIQVEKLLVGYHIPALVSDDTPAIEMIQSVLSGGKSSRLYRALVDTGIASSIDSYSLDDKDPSLFLITASLQKGKRAALAEAVIGREINRLLHEEVPPRELDRARNRLNFSFYEGLDSNYDKAQFLGHYEALAKGFEAGIREQKRIQTVTPADVLAVARRYLMPKNKSVITGVPK